MADEYITKEQAKQAVYEYCYYERYYGVSYEDKIDALPSADVAPVVRCRDCKHSYKFRGDLRRCTRHTEGVPGRPIVVEDDDFCCWGRKTEEVQK